MRLILVPTDFSAASERALEAAMDFAQLTGASLELLHVDPETIWVLPPPMDVVAAPIGLADTLATWSVQMEATISRVRAAGVTCTGVSQAGKAEVQIVDHARLRGANLIVVGSHGRQGLSHMLVGSVAEKVVRDAPCPILVVPGAEDERPGVRPDDETPETSEAVVSSLPV